MAAMPRCGDVVTVGNAMWAVAGIDGIRMELLRLNVAPDAREEAPEGRGNVLTVEQAADELGVHPKTVRSHLATGQLVGRKVGSQWRLLRSENPALAG